MNRTRNITRASAISPCKGPGSPPICAAESDRMPKKCTATVRRFIDYEHDLDTFLEKVVLPDTRLPFRGWHRPVPIAPVSCPTGPMTCIDTADGVLRPCRLRPPGCTIRRFATTACAGLASARRRVVRRCAKPPKEPPISDEPARRRRSAIVSTDAGPAQRSPLAESFRPYRTRHRAEHQLFRSALSGVTPTRDIRSPLLRLRKAALRAPASGLAS